MKANFQVDEDKTIAFCLIIHYLFHGLNLFPNAEPNSQDLSVSLKSKSIPIMLSMLHCSRYLYFKNIKIKRNNKNLAFLGNFISRFYLWANKRLKRAKRSGPF